MLFLSSREDGIVICRIGDFFPYHARVANIGVVSSLEGNGLAGNNIEQFAPFVCRR